MSPLQAYDRKRLDFDPTAQSGGDGSELASGQRWYVAMTLPCKERYAAANLADQGFRGFLPVQTVTTRHARQLRTKLAPVFPRYLFIIVDVERQRWRNVNGTFGVRYLICQGDRPLPVPVGVVETLLRSCDSAGRIIVSDDVLRPGVHVRLVSGPFAGLPGVLQRLDGAQRVRLLLEIMGAPVLVTAPRESLVAL